MKPFIYLLKNLTEKRTVIYLKRKMGRGGCKHTHTQNDHTWMLRPVNLKGEEAKRPESEKTSIVTV